MSAATAMVLVGSSAAVLAVLDGYPTFGGQAIRYAGAALVLAAAARMLGAPLRRPDPGDTLRLAVLAVTGLAGFSVCFMQAVRHADPSTVGAVIGGVPIVLAVVGAVADRRVPDRRIVAAGMAVTAGVAVSQGVGGSSSAGLAWACGALTAEVAFSVLAVPLLPRLGALSVSTWASTAAVPVLLVAGVLADGAGAVPMPTATEVGALAYLSVAVTAVAFLLWYSAVHTVGADRAGLLAGLAPISAVAAAAIVGTGSPRPADIAGSVLVGVGVAYGMSAGRTPQRGTDRSSDDPRCHRRPQCGMSPAPS